MQADALISDFGAPGTLKPLMLSFFAAYLRHLSDSQGSGGGAVSKIPQKQLPTLQHTLVITWLACRVLGLPLTVADLFHLARVNRLPYLTVSKQASPHSKWSSYTHPQFTYFLLHKVPELLTFTQRLELKLRPLLSSARTFRFYLLTITKQTECVAAPLPNLTTYIARVGKILFSKICGGGSDNCVSSMRPS
jgi:hypothetical protein